MTQVFVREDHFMSDNPFEAPRPTSESRETHSELPSSEMSGKETYNLVTDTVIGPNLRWGDNLLQAAFILVSIVIASIGGAVLAVFSPTWNLPWIGGALLGAFAGLVFGTFASGLFLMIYRGSRHLKGKHD
jgi:hypothetical protein